MACPPCPTGYRSPTSPHPRRLVLERASREASAPSTPSPWSDLRGTGARLVWPPCRARRRTAAPGSQSEGRSQESRRLISEARAREHIAPRPSSLIRIHCESQETIPAAQIRARRADASLGPAPSQGTSCRRAPPSARRPRPSTRMRSPQGPEGDGQRDGGSDSQRLRSHRQRSSSSCAGDDGLSPPYSAPASIAQ
jgi:hypothetical protein